MRHRGKEIGLVLLFIAALMLAWALDRQGRLAIAVTVVLTVASVWPGAQRSFATRFLVLAAALVGAAVFAARGDGDGLWVLLFPLVLFWWAVGLVLGRVVAHWVARDVRSTS